MKFKIETDEKNWIQIIMSEGEFTEEDSRNLAFGIEPETSLKDICMMLTEGIQSLMEGTYTLVDKDMNVCESK